jgi:hypothetical protein
MGYGIFPILVFFRQRLRMPLSLNEIKSRALAFSNEWAGETNEDAEAKSFWDGFFHIFGISRRRMATFEQAVAREGRGKGFIDLLWKGTLLVEHKSAGKNLERAYAQAKDYFPGLKDHELPRYIIVCDFENFRLYDLDEGWDKAFTLGKLVDNLHLFDFLSGYKRHVFEDQAPINIKAAEMMAMLHDELKAYGYEGHRLELYLVRLLFCLFADDTNIFEKGIFYDLLENRTHEDGSDLAGWLAQLFDVLDCPAEKRMRNLDEMLAAFPYVNGRLFEERLPMAAFDAKMRKLLLDCCALDWSAISPAIFGSLFQGVMDEKARRNLGAHYTSEKNIMKLIKPLFLDELWGEFEKVKGNQRQLEAFHGRIAGLRFLDPACGCGNFLIIAYRELRLLEIEVLRARFKNQIATHIDLYVNVNVDQFYGIEYEEFPAQIAQVAMWLMDHQMNIRVSEAFGEYYARLPLKKSATIVHGNALRTDWQGLIQEEGANYDYILGNPPFLGTAYQNAEQKADMSVIFEGTNSYGMLDYVTAWYIQAARYMQQINNKTVTAFVSTNSIAQGEQVGILWQELFNKYHIKIHFAHRTFKWNNEAKGNAAVHVVVIGFANYDTPYKKIFVYDDIKGDAVETIAKNINPYLVEGNDTFLQSISKPICNVTKMQSGSAARDGGFLILSDSEKTDIEFKYPSSKTYFKRFISGDDFINNIVRWCIWLKDKNPADVNNISSFIERFKEVRKFREKSTRAGTKKMASFPYLFAEERQPDKDFLLIPKVSSENRYYIPIAYLSKDYIVSDKTFVVPEATLFHFGVITSLMHMTWMRYVAGRLESRYSYSNTIVYNNYPWPEHPTDKQTVAVEKAAQAVLDARAQFPNASLADLYDPNTMPPALVKAHQALDKAVDLCYRPQPFATETKRIEYLFELYDKYTAGMFAESKNVKSKRKK